MLLNLRVEQVDIAAAHGDDQIAGLPMRAQIGFRIVKRRGIMRGALPSACMALTSMVAWISPGSFSRAAKDIRHQHLVGEVAAVDIIPEQRFDCGNRYAAA